MTRAEVAQLSLHEEFDLFGERYLQMQEVLKEAQLQVSEGSWGWNGGDVLPVRTDPILYTGIIKG